MSLEPCASPVRGSKILGSKIPGSRFKVTSFRFKVRFKVLRFKGQGGEVQGSRFEAWTWSLKLVTLILEPPNLERSHFVLQPATGNVKTFNVTTFNPKP